jgi:hypothetical protein
VSLVSPYFSAIAVSVWIESIPSCLPDAGLEVT